jgi:hypothetical protein
VKSKPSDLGEDLCKNGIDKLITQIEKTAISAIYIATALFQDEKACAQKTYSFPLTPNDDLD